MENINIDDYEPFLLPNFIYKKIKADPRVNKNVGGTKLKEAKVYESLPVKALTREQLEKMLDDFMQSMLRKLKVND